MEGDGLGAGHLHQPVGAITDDMVQFTYVTLSKKSVWPAERARYMLQSMALDAPVSLQFRKTKPLSEAF